MLLSQLMTNESTSDEIFIEQSDRNTRNQREDLNTAIDCLYEFKRTLIMLHPSVLPIIEGMLKTEHWN